MQRTASESSIMITSKAFILENNFNGITRYLHSFRFRMVRHYLDQLQKEAGNRQIVLVDIGCGQGGLYEVLRETHNIRYYGIDLHDELAPKGQAIYKDNPDVTIIHADAAAEGLIESCNPDIVVALESMEHIPEHAVVRIIERIGQVKSLKLFIASVPVEIGPAIWIKNIGSWLMRYVRHKEYTWGETFWAGLYQLDKLPRHGIKHKGFDWRWLAQTIRHNLKIIKTHKSPFDWVPAAFAPSILLVAKPDPHA